LKGSTLQKPQPSFRQDKNVAQARALELLVQVGTGGTTSDYPKISISLFKAGLRTQRFSSRLAG
jgi:hypothetical protein